MPMQRVERVNMANHLPFMLNKPPYPLILWYYSILSGGGYSILGGSGRCVIFEGEDEYWPAPGASCPSSAVSFGGSCEAVETWYVTKELFWMRKQPK